MSDYEFTKYTKGVSKSRAGEVIKGVADSQFSAPEITAALTHNIPIARCDYSVNNNLTLTTTPTVVTGWDSDYPTYNVNISEDGGVFTTVLGGLYKVDLERIYRNDDNNPSDMVIVHITVEADDQQGGGYVPIFDRTAPVSSATARDEPAILSFTTPTLLPATAGSKFRVLVSAEDGGGNPQDCVLVRSTLVAIRIGEL